MPLANRAEDGALGRRHGAPTIVGGNASAFGRVRAYPARGRAPVGGARLGFAAWRRSYKQVGRPLGRPCACALGKCNESPQFGFAERVRLFAVRQERGADEERVRQRGECPLACLPARIVPVP